MPTYLEALPKRNKRTQCTWYQPMPWCVRNNSAVLQKIAQACIGRNLLFLEGIVEEVPRLIRYERTSRRSFIIQFSVDVLQRLSDTSDFRESVEETRIIALCTHDEIYERFRISIIHSISVFQVLEATVGFGRPALTRLSYAFALTQFDTHRFGVFVRGTVYQMDPFSDDAYRTSRKFQRFVERRSFLAIDPYQGITKRLS